MSNFFHRNAAGMINGPVISKINGHTWVTLFGNPEDIPLESMNYVHTRNYPLDTNHRGALFEMDWAHSAIWLDLQKHWLGFLPTAPLVDADPVAFAFDELIPFVQHILSDSEGSENLGAEGVEYQVDPDWASKCQSTEVKLRHIIRTVAHKSHFYGPDKEMSGIGPVPVEADLPALRRRYDTEPGVLSAGARAQRCVLSCLGWLTWYLSVDKNWGQLLEVEDRNYVESLRSAARPKRGFLIKLSRDWPYVNIAHYIRHDVPVHLVWTADENRSERFFRYHPDLLKEYFNVLSHIDLEADVRLEDLPSYDRWASRLRRYDHFLYNRDQKNTEMVCTVFHPYYSYRVIDAPGWKSRLITDRNQARVYAEIFSCKIFADERGRLVCVFFRSEPLDGKDESDVRDRPAEHTYPLESFGSEPSDSDEKIFYEEPSLLIREMWKNKCAPTPSRKFSWSDGSRLRGNNPLLKTGQDSDSSHGYQPLGSRIGPSISQRGRGGPRTSRPPRAPRQDRERNLSRQQQTPRAPVSEQVESRDPPYQSRWVRQMMDARRRSSRSLSPRERGKNDLQRSRRGGSCVDSSPSRRSSSPDFRAGDNVEERLFRTYRSSSSSCDPIPIVSFSPRHSAMPGGLEDYAPSVSSQNEWVRAERQHRQTLVDWSPVVFEKKPPTHPPQNVEWDETFMKHAIYVPPDKRAYLRARVFANVVEDVNDIRQVLNLLIQYCVPFHLYIKSEDADLFIRPRLGGLLHTTMSELYEPGYQEAELVWGPTPMATLGRYHTRVRELLQRENAVAFIAEGGFVSLIARWYDDSLVARLKKGPTPQVSEYGRGKTMVRRPEGLPPVKLVRDGVSYGELDILWGRVSDGTPGGERWLWPTTELLEKYCDHYHGIISHGCKEIFELLLQDMKQGNPQWRTRYQWIAYFKKGQRKQFTPKCIPEATDYQKGWDLIDQGFPNVDWSYKPVKDIAVPDVYSPLLVNPGGAL